MDISVFLAKALGIYVLVISLALFFNRDGMQAVVKNISKNDGLMFVHGLLTLAIGTLLILTHNIWVMDKYVVVTVFSWLIFVVGVIRVAFPQYAVKMMKSFEKDCCYRFTTVLMLILGLYLVNLGFNVA